MIPETKIYSDFIKLHKVKVGINSFEFKGKEINLYKCENGHWCANEDDPSHTKKSAIYWYIKNHMMQ